jgi:hypothetical protein
MTSFTTISLGLCAYLAPGSLDHHQTLIVIGNTVDGVCQPFMFFPDTHGQTADVKGHTYRVVIDDSGGTLYFDGKKFYFVKDSI